MYPSKEDSAQNVVFKVTDTASSFDWIAISQEGSGCDYLVTIHTFTIDCLNPDGTKDIWFDDVVLYVVILPRTSYHVAWNDLLFGTIKNTFIHLQRQFLSTTFCSSNWHQTDFKWHCYTAFIPHPTQHCLHNQCVATRSKVPMLPRNLQECSVWRGERGLRCNLPLESRERSRERSHRAASLASAVLLSNRTRTSTDREGGADQYNTSLKKTPILMSHFCHRLDLCALNCTME